VAKTGTNTLEGYFHPRVLVFAVGVIAVSSFLRGRVAAPLVLLAAAGTIHPTTALWFLVWLAAAAVIARPGIRRYAGAAAIAAAFAGLWAVTAGPLAGHLAMMDAEWRQILEPKDYLFPLQWPLHAWVLNLGYLLVVGWIYVMRSRAGRVSPLERALVLGSASLVLIFAGALVLHAIGIVLAIQLQPARVFWMFDLLATVYGVWALAEGGALRTNAAAAVTASLLVAFSVVRGGYALATSDRPAIQVSIPDDDWGRAMTFVRSTPKDSSWLADPMHAALYGTSLRVAGQRDVFVEALKDSAIGMYDRDTALRTEERWARVRTFLTMTTEEFRALAKDYDLDFMITELHLDFPLVFQSGPLRIYRLK
jgi:hypothetical protein